MAKKKTVTPVEDPVAVVVEPVVEPIAPTLQSQLLNILATAPIRPRHLTAPTTDPEYVFAVKFDPAYNSFLDSLRRFADCLTQ